MEEREKIDKKIKEKEYKKNMKQIMRNRDESIEKEYPIGLNENDIIDMQIFGFYKIHMTFNEPFEGTILVTEYSCIGDGERETKFKTDGQEVTEYYFDKRHPFIHTRDTFTNGFRINLKPKNKLNENTFKAIFKFL